MDLHLERTGGFAGLRMSHDFGKSDLTAEDSAELNRLVASSKFFELPSEIKAANPGADRFRYKLRVQDGERLHTVELDDGAVPESLRPLLNWAMAKARKR